MLFRKKNNSPKPINESRGREAAYTRWNSASQLRPTNFFAEVSECLKWAHDRSTALGVAGLALANCFWLEFIFQYHIPVSIFSPALLAALPTMLIAIVMMIIVLFTCTMVPAIVLGSPLGNGLPSLVEMWKPSSDSEYYKAIDPWNRWLIATFAILFIWAAVISASTWIKAEPNIALILGTLALSVTLSLKILTWRISFPFSFEFYVSAVAGLTVQSMYVLAIGNTTLGLTPVGPPLAIATPWVALFAVLIFIGGGQVALATMIKRRGLYRGFSIHVLISAGVAMSFLACFPPVAGRLAGVAINLSGTGARNCLILSLKRDAATRVAAEILAASAGPMRPLATKSLGFAALLDGSFYVHTTDGDETTYTVPQDAVLSVRDCRSTTTNKAPR
jgi:hypothetical protein